MKKKNENVEPTAPVKKGGVSDGFKQAIKKYLDQRAAEDELFAKTYAKENKNLEECCNYILQEVQKSGRNGFTDDEIYNMAIHYYDEDDIKNVKSVAHGRIVVNHVEEFTAAEKAEIKEQAKEAYKNEQLEKLKEKERKSKEKRIKKAKEAAEHSNSLQLSLFDM